MDLRKNQYHKLHNGSLIEAELGCLAIDSVLLIGR